VLVAMLLCAVACTSTSPPSAVSNQPVASTTASFSRTPERTGEPTPDVSPSAEPSSSPSDEPVKEFAMKTYALGRLSGNWISVEKRVAGHGIFVAENQIWAIPLPLSGYEATWTWDGS